MYVRRLPVMAAIMLGLVFEPLSAQTSGTSTREAVPNHPSLTDRFFVELGGFYSRSSTQASLSGAGGGAGVIIDFENALGLDERTLTPTTGLLWRMSDRWRLEIEYFDLDRDARRILEREVTWGNRTFTPETQMESQFNFYDARMSVGYSLFKRTDKELGIGLGVHAASIEAELEALQAGTEKSDILAPLPVINFFGGFALTDAWAVKLRVDWLSLAYDDYSGDIRNTTIDMLYQPFDHIGFGFGVRNLVLDLEIDDPDWTGRVRTVFSGPTAFVNLSF